MTVRLGNFTFTFSNLPEFLTIYKDIFFHNEYKFVASSVAPRIIDCGAHIGISVFYFKKLYPKAIITAFEANPVTFSLLQKNIDGNGFSSVHIHNKAVSNRTGKIDFYISKSRSRAWNCGDSAAPNPWITKQTHRKISVDSVTLSDHIDGHVHLLKLDVEGMETRVLYEIRHKLKFIDEIILEFHGNAKNWDNRLSKIYTLLTRHNFSCHTYPPHSLFHPVRREVEPEVADKTERGFFIVYAKKSA